MDASLSRSMIQIIVAAVLTSVVVGELERVSQSCCHLGSSWANSNGLCDTYPKPIPGVPDDFQLLCYSVLEACCVRSHRSKNCDKGKETAYIGKECTVLKSTAGESHKDCCDGCKFGFFTAESHEPCKVPLKTFGALWEESFLSCCFHREQLIQNETKTVSTTEATLTKSTTSITTPMPIAVTTSIPKFSSHCGNRNFCSQVCTDTEQGIECSCFTGYILATDQKTCEDIDECALGINNCILGNDICQNTVGGFQCLPDRSMIIPLVPTPNYCPTGFVWSSPSRGCYDIDECALGTHTCTSRDQCSNTIGSYTCQRSFDQACATGYEYDSTSANCIDIDECALGTHTCVSIDQCSNTIGSFTCQRSLNHACSVGYRYDAAYASCIDIDECALGTHTCVSRNLCSNTIGSFTCQRNFNRACTVGYRYDASSANCIDIDECTLGTHSCISRDQCSNTIGSFTCQRSFSQSCETGYKYDATSAICTDIDECALGTHTCTTRDQCSNTIGSYTCQRSFDQACATGYEYDANLSTCIDVDECTLGTHTCISRDRCSNTVGSFICQIYSNQVCTQGYKYDASSASCIDIDECSEGLHSCHLEQICSNTIGSYNCIFQRRPKCPPGYKLSPANLGTPETCIDVDECNENIHTCDKEKEDCINDIGTYICLLKATPTQACPSGYEYNEREGRCNDINECNNGQNNCSQVEICINTNGSYHCQRKPSCAGGYTLDLSGRSCTDINECLEPDACDRRYQCVNTFGSYLCRENNKCRIGYRQDSNSHCIDIDECTEQTSDCGSTQVCKNTQGSYTCRCPPGYAMLTLRHCEDIDECQRTQVCPSNSQCRNTLGSYECHCKDGFKKENNTTRCGDVNECVDKPYICQHKCINTWGSYKCSCEQGYTLQADKWSCEDFDECEELKKHGKLCFGQCINLPGSYSCSCPQGYSLSHDSRSCEDINECQNTHVCRENNVCVNTHGGYNCTTVSCPNNYIEQVGQISSTNKAPTISCKKQCNVDDVTCLTNTTQTIVYQFISLPTIHKLRSPLILTTMRAIVKKRRYHFDSEYNILEGNNEGYFDILRGNGVGSLRLVWPVSGPREFVIKIQMSISPKFNKKIALPTLHHIAFIYVSVSSYDY